MTGYHTLLDVGCSKACKWCLVLLYSTNRTVVIPWMILMGCYRHCRSLGIGTDSKNVGKPIRAAFEISDCGPLINDRAFLRLLFSLLLFPLLTFFFAWCYNYPKQLGRSPMLGMTCFGSTGHHTSSLLFYMYALPLDSALELPSSTLGDQSEAWNDVFMEDSQNRVIRFQRESLQDDSILGEPTTTFESVDDDNYHDASSMVWMKEGLQLPFQGT